MLWFSLSSNAHGAVGIYRDYLTVRYANDRTFDRSPLLMFIHQLPLRHVDRNLFKDTRSIDRQ